MTQNVYLPQTKLFKKDREQKKNAHTNNFNCHKNSISTACQLDYRSQHIHWFKKKRSKWYVNFAQIMSVLSYLLNIV